MLERLMDKVEKNPNSGCWRWTGPKFKTGYGLISYNGASRGVHRVMAVIVGLLSDIRALQEVHHTCAQYTCINPDHLVLGTSKDRILKKPHGSGQDLNSKSINYENYTKKPIQKPINPRLGINTLYGETPIIPIGHENVQHFINKWKQSYQYEIICIKCWKTIPQEDLKKHESIHNRKKRRKRLNDQ